MRRRRNALAICLGLFAGQVLSANAGIVPLGIPSNVALYGRLGVNNAGSVVSFGMLDDRPEVASVRWNSAASLPAIISNPIDVQFQAVDVDESGLVVGVARVGGSASRAATWRPDDFGYLGGPKYGTYVSSVAASGRIAGMKVDGSTGARFAVIWNRGTISELVPPGLHDTEARDIDSNGNAIVVGETNSQLEQSYLWHEGSFSRVMIENNDAIAYCIADDGAILASKTGIGGADNGLYLVRSSVASALPLPADVHITHIWGMNNSHQIIGTAQTDHDFPFLLDESGFVDLNTMLPAGTPWQLYSATDINDHGAIVGMGLLDGVEHPFVLTVPEPTTAVLIGAVTTFFAFRRRR